jgi:Enolase C-terminal domain-like
MTLPVRRRRRTRGCTAIAAPRRRSTSRCTTFSGARAAGPRASRREAAQPDPSSCRHRIRRRRGRPSQRSWNAGYRAFKIKVGLGSPEADATRTRAICQALKREGEPCLVSADANQGFSVDGALGFVRAIGDWGLDFFEQPVDAHDLTGMSRVAAAAQIPIGSDEGIHRPGDIARHHERKAAGGVSLKAIKLGGLRGLVEASRLCERLSMHVNISCKTGETSLAPAAAIHAAAVAPEIAWGLTVTSAGLAEDVAAVSAAHRPWLCRSAATSRARHRDRQSDTALSGTIQTRRVSELNQSEKLR